MANVLRQAKVTVERNGILPVDSEEFVDIKRASVLVTVDHCDRGRWARFYDPISLALKEEVLNENSCCCVLWESDGWKPRAADDEANILIYTEKYNEEGEFLHETTYQVKLPRRAELNMRRLAGVSKGIFEPTVLAVDVPVMALRE